ncbi:MAG: flavoprotein [Ktedonobacteraceae bacterium]|nr:flavoprotein [Ktedonobacteraceae bacterium]
MIQQEHFNKGVLYIIVCGTEYATRVHNFVGKAQQAGWEVCVVLTPMATRFVDVAQLAQLTKHPVRSEYKRPEDPDVLPRADALLVFGATFNTINKWALGISDNLALGLLCEYTGLKKPILAIPVVRQGGGLDTHPAFSQSLHTLRRYGISVFYEPEVYPPRNEVPDEIILGKLQRVMEDHD